MAKNYVTGAKSVQNAFRQMRKLYTTPVSEAQRYALQPMLAAAKANTPHKRIKKALVIRKEADAPKDKPAYSIGGNKNNPDYRLLHLLELGTDPHRVNHPGTAPQPFLTPAFEAHDKEAIKRFGEKIGPAQEKAFAKLVAKGGGK